MGDELHITWKAFLLEQVNSRRGLEWKAWKDRRFTSRDIPPHEGAKSVLAEHGAEAFERFHLALFRAYHLDKRDIANPLEILAVAREVELDTTRLAEDLRTRKYRDEIGTDHDEADEQYDIFGVPTILFNGQQPTFIKLDAGTWEGPDDMELFQALFQLVATRPYVMEVKKPASAAVAAVSATRQRQERGES